MDTNEAIMVRPMRGQVVIREDIPSSDVIIIPHHNPRAHKWHRGRVIALGAPPLTSGGAEIPWDVAVGDEVVYVWHHLEKLTTRPWPPDGKTASWLPWTSVLAVLE